MTRTTGPSGAPDTDRDADPGTGPAPTRQGPIYDTSMRGIMSGALWSACAALGVPISAAAQPVAATFAATTFTTDLLLADGDTRIVHVEYESGLRAPITARMLVYRGMIMQKHPRCEVDQYIVFLGEGLVGQVRGWPWPVPFQAIYLRDLDPERFLGDPALAPLAVLAEGTGQDRRQVFVRALEIIRSRGGDRLSELLEQASVLATIRLDRPTH